MDYLEELGIEVLYINPLFERYEFQEEDKEYIGVLNHTNVDPVIGTVEDVEKLTTELSSRGIHFFFFLSSSLNGSIECNLLYSH